MKIGLQIYRFDFAGGPASIGPVTRDIVQYADSHGFSSLWVMDHLFQMEMVNAESPMLEAYTALAYFAGLTRNVTLGALVTAAIYRHPGVLAKTVTTLDVLSGGRAILGIGAGWYEREARALGIPYPPTSERFERLEETLQIVLQMWSGEVKPYTGKHFHLAETLNVPAALSRPHPRILIGGQGEKKTLRLVAQYADACNLFLFNGAAVLAQKLDVLKEHCEAIGRPYESIEKTGLGTINPGRQSATELIALCRQMAGLGFTHLIFNMDNIEDPAALRILGEQVIPEVAHL